MKSFIILCLILPFAALSQELAEVVNSALEYNSQIKAADLQMRSAGKEVDSEKRANLPVFSVKAHYIHNTDVPQFDIPLPGFNGNVTLNPQDNYETGIHMDYVLFSGFAQSQAEKVKGFEYALAGIKKEQQSKDIAFKTIQAYRNAQLMQLSLEIMNDTRRRNQVQMQKVKALLENGMALQLDTLSLSLNATTIEQQIIASQSVLENWFQILHMLTGRDIDPYSSADLQENPPFNDFVLQEQNAFREVRIQEKKMKAVSTVSKAGYYPKIWLNASFNYGRPGPDIITNEWDTYGKWMVGLQWDIWNWGATAISVQAKDLKYQALQQSEQSVEDNLRLNYDKAVRAFRMLQKQKKVAEKSVIVAREKMQIVAISAEKGQMSSSDFNEANLELSQAEIRQKQILIQLNLQAAEIDYLSGKPVNMWRL